MTKPRDPDALLSAYLADGMEVLPDRVVDSVLGEVHRTRQRAVFGPRRTRSMVKTALGAAAVVAVLVSGATLFLSRPGQPGIGGPSPTPTVRPSQSDAARPSASPSASAALLIWTRASLDEDWPAPVRSEPDGGAIVLSRERAGFEYADPSGDTGSAVHPWVDIRELQVHRTFMLIDLVANLPPAVDPTDQCIAYGVVVDTDRDGVPDWRYGIDKHARRRDG